MTVEPYNIPSPFYVRFGFQKLNMPGGVMYSDSNSAHFCIVTDGGILFTRFHTGFVTNMKTQTPKGLCIGRATVSIRSIRNSALPPVYLFQNKRFLRRYGFE